MEKSETKSTLQVLYNGGKFIIRSDDRSVSVLGPAHYKPVAQPLTLMEEISTA